MKNSRSKFLIFKSYHPAKPDQLQRQGWLVLFREVFWIAETWRGSERDLVLAADPFKRPLYTCLTTEQRWASDLQLFPTPLPHLSSMYPLPNAWAWKYGFGYWNGLTSWDVQFDQSGQSDRLVIAVWSVMPGQQADCLTWRLLSPRVLELQQWSSETLCHQESSPGQVSS